MDLLGPQAAGLANFGARNPFLQQPLAANQPMANNIQNLYPMGNPQHGQALPMTVNGLYGAAAINLPPGNAIGGIPFTLQHYQMNLNKDTDVMQYLTARNNNDNLLLNYPGRMNPPANIPAPNFPQLNIMQPNMTLGNVMAFPNLYLGAQNNVLQNNAAPVMPPAPLIPENLPIRENHERMPPGQNDDEDMEDNDPDTPGIATPDITDDESHWTAFDRAIKTRKLLKEALKTLLKADLIDKDAEILHICDLVEVKIKKIYDNLDELDDINPHVPNQA